MYLCSSKEPNNLKIYLCLYLLFKLPEQVPYNQSQFQEISLKNKNNIDSSFHEANYRIKPISVPRIHQEEKNIDGFSNRQQQLNSLHEANSTQFTSHEKTYY